MPEDTNTPAADARLPIAACDFTLYQEATLNEYMSAITQMYNATRLIAATLLQTGQVTPANPVMQFLMQGASSMESCVANAQQQAQQAQAQSRIMAPTLSMAPRGKMQ